MNVLNLFPKLTDIKSKIEEVEVFKINVDTASHFSYGTWENRQHGILRISSAGKSGWGEERMTVNEPDMDLEEWANCFSNLKGLTISDALRYVREKINKDSTWDKVHTEWAEMVLIDLAGRLLNLSALELLGLSAREPVPGLYCILQRDTTMVEKKAKEALKAGLKTHLKVKLYGENELDKEVVKTARAVMGAETFIIGDVNRGYRKEYQEGSIDDIAENLIRLHQSGLDACEDPAQLSQQQWVELQKKVKPLSLVPDNPMRPASDARANYNSEMGEIFNIHPRCTASILDTVLLGKVIIDSNRKLMIGDGSLVGPACLIWQQLAIGLGAEWVESLEKPEQSTAFQDSIIDRSNELVNGKVALSKGLPGFGFIVDEKLLRQNALSFHLF